MLTPLSIGDTFFVAGMSNIGVQSTPLLCQEGCSRTTTQAQQETITNTNTAANVATHSDIAPLEASDIDSDFGDVIAPSATRQTRVLNLVESEDDRPPPLQPVISSDNDSSDSSEIERPAHFRCQSSDPSSDVHVGLGVNIDVEREIFDVPHLSMLADGTPSEEMVNIGNGVPQPLGSLRSKQGRKKCRKYERKQAANARRERKRLRKQGKLNYLKYHSRDLGDKTQKCTVAPSVMSKNDFPAAQSTKELHQRVRLVPSFDLKLTLKL